MEILAVDIGNTNARFAWMRGLRVRKTYALPTRRLRSGRLPVFLRKLKTPDAVVIASVVSKAGISLKNDIAKRLGWKTYLVGRHLPVPIKNCYRDPGRTGVDRLLNALAAYARCKKAVIVVDFGTAVTVDAVSAKGEFLGGAIAPGLETSLWALHAGTSKLPRIKPAKTPGAVGQSTREAILAGCVIGIGGLCDRLAERLRAKLGSKTLVIATGGDAQWMAPYCRTVRRVHEHLIFEGIARTCRTHFYLDKNHRLDRMRAVSTHGNRVLK